MSKKNKLLLIAGAALVVLLGIVYFFLSRSSNAGQEDEKQKDDTVYLFENAAKENISTFSVDKNGENLYTIFYDEKTDELLLSGYEINPYSTTFSSIFSRLPSLSVTGTVADALEKERYGLDGENAYTVTLSTKDGKTQKVYIGEKLVSGGGYYAQKDGSDEILTVTDRVEMLFCDKLSLLSMTLASPIDSSKYFYTESFKLYKDMKPFVEIELIPEQEREEGNAYGMYRMLYPASYTPADVNYDTVLKSLVNPSAEAIVTTEITPENLEKYGLTKPSFEIYYTYEGLERSLYFGTRTGDGLIYVLSDEFGFIGLVGIEKSFPFLDWDLIRYVNPALFGMNIDRVSKISISAPDFEETYRLDGLGDALVVTAESNGKTVDTYNFRQLYRVLLMTSMEGYADDTSTDDWALTFAVETRDENVNEYVFYRRSTRKCFYTVNGAGEFYVSIDDVNKILSDAKKLRNGESINAESQL